MKILNLIFFSQEARVVMLLILILSIAAATFIENDFGTGQARAAVYNAKWFEVFIIFIAISLICDSVKNKFWQKKKRLASLIPLAILIIILGTGLTRYLGYEGLMHLREGEVSNIIASGTKETTIPFSLKLVDFQIDRYPGSEMPSSFASQVIILDKERNIEKPYLIYMNHILKHRGFRFFQHSYDEDETGTILLVSHDPGTLVTYIGFVILTIGLLTNLIHPESRFRKLGRIVAQLQKQRVTLTFIIMTITTLLSVISSSVQAESHENIEWINSIDYEHSRKFGELLLQDDQGRIKPVNTFAHEILNKMARSDKILGLHPDQFALGILVKKEEWQNIRMIKVDHSGINKILSIEPERKFASFLEFFDPQTNEYRLAIQIQEASRKPNSHKDKFDKALIRVNERVNIFYMLIRGHFYRIFPKQDDPDQRWAHSMNAVHLFPFSEARHITRLIRNYLNAVKTAMKDKRWERADTALALIKAYQKQLGAAIVPSPAKVKAEILLNESRIFPRLLLVYTFTGLLLLILALCKIFKSSIRLQILNKICSIFLIIGFTAHTAGLCLRWYVSGHAPWSNGYETMIYIAWATILAGLILSKRSPLPVAATSIMAGAILFAAHLSWMDPQITNLVPVLKSYWLMIHVSVITASYGFLGLGTLLAFITLVLFVFLNQKNAQRIESSIRELTFLNERTLITGLTLVTIGTCLGAVWANESWGRYWGWDPKETWALVIILIYTVVLYLRQIPRFRSVFTFNVAALLAFSSVLMTYFGVNYYLSGLHSYAKGDPFPIPKFVYYTAAIIAVIIVLSFRRRKLQFD